jgi:nucleoside-diphosphate-sugar epimerase
MKLAITGGAGFLGYHICNKLADKYKLLIIDIAPIDPNEYPQDIEYLNIDVRNYDMINHSLKGVDFVIHAAAALPLWRKKDIYEVNVNGTRNVLEAASKNNVKRVIYISSTAVYGVPKKHPIYETDELIGVGTYGKTKIIAEKICEEYRKKGMCVPIIRPKTFIGTGRLGVFQILYDWVKSGKKIPIIGNGKNRYQLLEVEDLVDAIYLLLTCPPDKANDTYNVGAKEFGSVFEDVTALCEFAKTGAKVMKTPSSIVKFILAIFEILKISPLYKWVYMTADTDSFVSIEKIEKALNWSPKYSNAQALINSYKWYLAHCNEITEFGVTHRTAWKQGILGFFKRFL